MSNRALRYSPHRQWGQVGTVAPVVADPVGYGCLGWGEFDATAGSLGLPTSFL